jgi:PhnB protein
VKTIQRHAQTGTSAGSSITSSQAEPAPLGVSTATESDKGLVINAALDRGAFTLRASDRADATVDVQTRIELTINGSEEDDLRRIFDALSDGGTIKAHLEKMFWGDIFGALIDRFGIGWQVNISAS